MIYTNYLNLVSKHINVSLSESPCLLAGLISGERLQDYWFSVVLLLVFAVLFLGCLWSNGVRTFLWSSAMGIGQTRCIFIVRHWAVRFLSFVFHLHWSHAPN